jgi:uncharacterized protein
MKPAWLGGLPPFNRLLFFFVLMIASFGAFFLAGMLLSGPLFGITASKLPEVLADYENPSSVTILKYFQVIQSLGLFIVPPLLAGWVFERNITGYLALDRTPSWTAFGLVILAMVVMIPLVNGMIAWNESMELPEALSGMEDWMKRTEEEAAKLTGAFLENNSTTGLLMNLFIIAVLPALGEEFLFRGVLQRLLHEWIRNIHAAILISALAFSAMHLQFYGLLPRFFLGVVFGYLFFWTGSLWIPIFVHFLNNATAVIYETMVANGKATEAFGTYGHDSWLLIILSAMLTGLVLFLVCRRRMKELRT